MADVWSLEAVLSILPGPALRALRAACKPARDAVDARHIRSARPLFDAPASTLLAAAPRLHTLRRLDLSGCGCGPLDRCAALADLLPRLPGGGDALEALDLGYFHLPLLDQRSDSGGSSDDTDNSEGEDEDEEPALDEVERLAAALERLPALAELRVVVIAGDDARSSARFLAALLAAAPRMPALARVKLGAHRAASAEDFVAALPPLGALLLLRQIESLELGGAMVLLLPQLARATALTRLRAMELNFNNSSECRCLRELWSARDGWLPSLTRLCVKGIVADNAIFDPPPPLPVAPSLVDLLVSGCGAPTERAFIFSTFGDDNAVRRLAAAVAPARLEALRLRGLQYKEPPKQLAALASEMPRLRALTVFGGEENDYGEGWRALQAAPFAPLECLEVLADWWLLSDPAHFGALLAAPWAAPLREVAAVASPEEPDWDDEVEAENELERQAAEAEENEAAYVASAVADAIAAADAVVDGAAGGGVSRGDERPRQPVALSELLAMSALSTLPRLRALCLESFRLTAASLSAAAAVRVCEWARRITELTVKQPRLHSAALVALARLPFRRLERLRIDTFTQISAADLGAFAEAGAAWLGRLRVLVAAYCEIGERAALRAAVLGPGGPLAALHRGGGEVRLEW